MPGFAAGLSRLIQSVVDESKIHLFNNGVPRVLPPKMDAPTLCTTGVEMCCLSSSATEIPSESPAPPDYDFAFDQCVHCKFFSDLESWRFLNCLHVVKI